MFIKGTDGKLYEVIREVTKDEINFLKERVIQLNEQKARSTKQADDEILQTQSVIAELETK